MTKCPPPMKILISPTQSEKFERCAHMEYMPIRLYVRKDHKGAGGFEVAGSIKNPLYDPETAEIEGEGVKKNIRRLKKVVKIGGKVAGAVAPAVALVAPQVGLGLGVASAATKAVLGDGEVAASVVEETGTHNKKRAKKHHAKELPRYAVAKKKKTLILETVITQVGHASTTSGRELDRVMRKMLAIMGVDPSSVFGGIYAIDRVPQSTRRYQIVNTDPAPGRHWFAVSPDGLGEELRATSDCLDPASYH
jgi:hypothetical protein